MARFVKLELTILLTNLQTAAFQALMDGCIGCLFSSLDSGNTCYRAQSQTVLDSHSHENWVLAAPIRWLAALLVTCGFHALHVWSRKFSWLEVVWSLTLTWRGLSLCLSCCRMEFTIFVMNQQTSVFQAPPFMDGCIGWCLFSSLDSGNTCYHAQSQTPGLLGARAPLQSHELSPCCSDQVAGGVLVTWEFHTLHVWSRKSNVDQGTELWSRFASKGSRVWFVVDVNAIWTLNLAQHHIGNQAIVTFSRVANISIASIVSPRSAKQLLLSEKSQSN